VADLRNAPCIYVLAGTNGAGKSSLGGAAFLESGVEFFNPDEAALQIQSVNPGITATQANSAAWHQGKRLLQRAISERLTFAFETTLGGKTITTLLEAALDDTLEVRIWYVGLLDVNLHIQRVRSRVVRGGHDIPESRIRSRYDSSRLNLIRLLPQLTELRLYDNSADADPAAGKTPKPVLLLHLVGGRIETSCNLTRTPAWARPIMTAAMKINPR
jgi:predicted ABC-type ATPase